MTLKYHVNHTILALTTLLIIGTLIVNASTNLPINNSKIQLLSIFSPIVSLIRGIISAVASIFLQTRTSTTISTTTVLINNTTILTTTTTIHNTTTTRTSVPALISTNRSLVKNTTISNTKFNITAAEASGAQVFNDSTAPGGYIYSIDGIVYDIYGNYLYNSNPNPLKPYWNSCVANASFTCANLTYTTTGILKLAVGQMPGFTTGRFAFVQLKDSNKTINSSGNLNYTYLSSLNYIPTTSDNWLILNVSLPVARGSALSGYIWDRYWAGNVFRYIQVASIESRAILNSTSTSTTINYHVSQTITTPGNNTNGSNYISKLLSIASEST